MDMQRLILNFIMSITLFCAFKFIYSWTFLILYITYLLCFYKNLYKLQSVKSDIKSFSLQWNFN